MPSSSWFIMWQCGPQADPLIDPRVIELPAVDQEAELLPVAGRLGLGGPRRKRQTPRAGDLSVADCRQGRRGQRGRQTHRLGRAGAPRRRVRYICLTPSHPSSSTSVSIAHSDSVGTTEAGAPGPP
jgi:hypothetical protein